MYRPGGIYQEESQSITKNPLTVTVRGDILYFSVGQTFSQSDHVSIILENA